MFKFYLPFFVILLFLTQMAYSQNTTPKLTTEDVQLYNIENFTNTPPSLIQFGITASQFVNAIIETKNIAGSCKYISEEGVLRITAPAESIKQIKDRLNTFGTPTSKKNYKSKIIFLDNHDVNISTMLWNEYSNKTIGNCEPLPDIQGVFIQGPVQYIEKSIEFFNRFDRGEKDILIKSYPIWWGNGEKTKQLLEAALDKRGYAPPPWSSRLHLQVTKKEEILRVIDQQYVHDIIERLFSDPEFIEQAAPGETSLREFLIMSPHAIGKDGTIVRLPYFQHAVLGIEALLYGESGQRRAQLDGHAMTTNYEQASVQILDTSENLNRVDKFLSRFLKLPSTETASVHILNFITANEAAAILKDADIGQSLTILTSLGTTNLMLLGNKQEVRYADNYLAKLDTPTGLASPDNEAQVVRYYYPQHRSGQYLIQAFSQGESRAQIQKGTLTQEPRIQLNGPKSIIEDNLKKIESFDQPPTSYIVQVYLLDLLGAEGQHLNYVSQTLRNTFPITNEYLIDLQKQEFMRVICSASAYTIEDRTITFGQKQPHLARLNIPQHNGWFVEATPRVQPNQENNLTIHPLVFSLFKNKELQASVNETLLLNENNQGQLLIPAWKGEDDQSAGPWYLLVRLIEVK